MTQTYWAKRAAFWLEHVTDIDTEQKYLGNWVMIMFTGGLLLKDGKDTFKFIHLS